MINLIYLKKLSYMMKKNIGLFCGLFFMIPFLNGQELKSELTHRLRVQDCGFELKKVGKISIQGAKHVSFLKLF
jgi:hypothetical protein